MRRLIGIALITGLLIGSGIGYAAAQCASNHCLYLPDVRASGDRCADADQRQSTGNGFANWLTEYTITPGEPLAVCLFASSAGPTTQYYAIAHQRSGDIQTEIVAHPDVLPLILRLVVPTDQFTPGELVEIDVVLSRQPAQIQRVGQLYCLVRAP